MIKRMNVSILPSQESVEVANGTLLSEAIQLLFPDTDFPCGGKGLCRKCRCLLTTSSGSRSVWACQFPVGEDVEVSTQFPLRKKDVDMFIVESVEKHVHSPLGIAVDVGTTTLAFSIMDLEKRVTIAQVEATNPQVAFGADVMTRITFCQEHPEGLEVLQRALFVKLDNLLARAMEKGGLDATRVQRIVMAGNTCMEHILCGVSPIGLGMSPYQASFLGSEYVHSSRVPLSCLPAMEIQVAPVIGGFVGGDIAAGILSTQLHRRSGPAVFVDVGTNGEIVVADNGSMVGASSAAGPAFEGAGISCGQRAAPGAIYCVALHGSPVVRTIQGISPPVGFCGSGIFSAIAELIRNGIVDSTGRLLSPERWPADVQKNLHPYFQEEYGDRRFYFTKDVFVSQNDIRQVQLAKSAIRSNLDILLAAQGLDPSLVEKVFLGGTFGLHITLNDAYTLGLLPKEFDGRVRQLGNTCLAGAMLLTLYPHLLKGLENTCRSIKIINLATIPYFQDIFLSNLSFLTT